MHPTEYLSRATARAISTLYDHSQDPQELSITPTRKEFAGDFTVVTFPLSRVARKGPEQIGQEIGDFLVREEPDVFVAFNVIKGFLNVSLSDALWKAYLKRYLEEKVFQKFPSQADTVLVEYSSPNTNKPLHLGHVRNILLGWSVSQILERVGFNVQKVQVINDRGIAICKSMLAWQKFGEGVTPETAGVKGDHLIGEYYVRFEQEFKAEYSSWQNSSRGQSCLQKAQEEKPELSEEAFFAAFKNTYFNEHSALGAEARSMLRQWEEGEPEVRQLWETMNSWVYQGFQITYDRLGVTFDRSYYESQTYLLGRDLIERGLTEGIFYRKEDGSCWIDLEEEGLDHKLVLRSDGTSVYITQDLGTAEDRYKDTGAARMIYVVADEQNYHFQVLFAIMKRLGAAYADGMSHLSYGMVELPTGRMKSREGTVVDADDLIDEVIAEARASAEERGELEDAEEVERMEIYRKIGLAALKYHMIKVHPRKKMIFDPRESVDLQGHTGPYIQNAYVRIQSIFRKAGQPDATVDVTDHILAPAEKDLIITLGEYRAVIQQAADQYDPSHIANYAYGLAKAYHKFYHEHSILHAPDEISRQFRLQLSTGVAETLFDAMHLLGIEMPQRM